MIDMQNNVANLLMPADTQSMVEDSRNFGVMSELPTGPLELTAEPQSTDVDTKKVAPNVFLMLLSQMMPVDKASSSDTVELTIVDEQAQQDKAEYADVNEDANASLLNTGLILGWMNLAVENQTLNSNLPAQVVSGGESSDQRSPSLMSADVSMTQAQNALSKEEIASLKGEPTLPNIPNTTPELLKESKINGNTDSHDNDRATKELLAQFTTNDDDLDSDIEHQEPNLGAAGVQRNDTVAVNINQGMVPPVNTGHTKSIEIATPLISPQWADKFSEQVAWLGQNEIKSALIKIHPEELGPIQISIKLDKHDASVTILSASVQARDVVNEALPKLRDMLADQGLNLANVNVGVDQQKGQSDQNHQNEDQMVFSNANSETDIKMVSEVRRKPKGLVDYFA